MMIASRWIFTCVTTLVLTEIGQVLPRATVIRGASPCATCRIELEKVITLGGATEAEGLVGGGPWLATDSRGRYYIGPTATGGQVLVFGADGKLLRSIGRLGRGPGELEAVLRTYIDAGDTIHVFDRTRHSRFAPDFRFIDAAPLRDQVYYAIFYPNGRSVQQFAVSVSPLRHGPPIHTVAGSGLVLRSFGLTGDDTLFGPRTDTYGMRHPLAKSSGGTFWTARFNAYVLEKWDTTGRLLQRIERQVDWFKPWRGSSGAGRPKLQQLHEDSEGRVWTMIPHDGIVTMEVIDPRTSTLVASTDFTSTSAFLRQFAGDLVLVYRETPSLEPLVDVFRPRLRLSNDP